MKRAIIVLLLLSMLLSSCATEAPEMGNTEGTNPTESTIEADQTESTSKEEEPMQPIILTDQYCIVAEESTVAHAERVRDAIKKATKITLPIVTDGNTERCEIVLADSRRSEIKALVRELASPFLGAVVVKGERILLAAGSEQALEPTVEAFIAEIPTLTKNKTMTLSADYRLEKNCAARIAKDVITSITCEPKSETRVQTDTVRIFTPDGSENDWYFNHVPFITQFKDRFYIFYSSGPVNESDCGQRVMMATSTDFEKWKVEVLLDSVPGQAADMLLTARSCYVVDGKLTLFFYKYEYYEEFLRYENGKPVRPIDTTRAGVGYGMFYIQTEDGKNWSKPVSIGFPSAGNACPEILQSGALLWAGNGQTAYSDSYLDIENWSNQKLKLASDTVPTKNNTESDFVQMPDGTVLIFSRTGSEVMLGAASFDDGKTWTDMYRTQFTDSDARFRFGILPDGRYYFLGNMSYARNELLLITSEDGIHYDEWYYLGEEPYTLMKKGLAKGGTYSYPDMITDGEYLYIVYSLKKESIEVKRVKLSDLTPEN